MGAAFIDLDVYESIPLFEAADRPGRELAEYKFRLARARRRAIRSRLDELVNTIDSLLSQILTLPTDDPKEEVAGELPDQFKVAVAEVEALLGDTVDRSGRWSHLHRHLGWSQAQDWHDIREFDWPSVRADIEAAMSSPLDPLDVPSDDLGVLAASNSTGGVTVGLPWERLTDERLEALLFDLIRSYPNHSNVQWLMRTNAPDRGRDISFERRLQLDTGNVRNERVIVQAKHWQSKSVAVSDVMTLLGQVALWEPPTVHALIVATTGRFASDAVQLAESHNDGGKRPSLELWPDSQLETLLSQRPGIAAGYGLR